MATESSAPDVSEEEFGQVVKFIEELHERSAVPYEDMLALARKILNESRVKEALRGS